MDIVDICTRKRANTKWKFYKLTVSTIFASILKDVPMGCKDTVLHEPLLINRNVNCLTFERNTKETFNDNLCLFRALALHLHDNEKLEDETSKNFNLFLNNSEEGDVSQFQGVHLNDIPKVEDLLQLNTFLFDFDFVDGELIGEPCRRSIQKYEKIVKLLRYNNHTCYVNNINALFKAFRCITFDTSFSKTGNLERHLVIVVIILNIFNKRKLTKWEKCFLKSLMHSTYHRKNCSRTWQYLTLSPFVSRKTHTSKVKLQRGSGSMCLYQFQSRQTPSLNPFFFATPNFSISSRFLSLLSKDQQLEPKLRWNWISLK